MTADLALANARLVWTVPQAAFEAPPEAARLIEEAERADPSPGPFRVHRLPDWFPARFVEHRSADRFRELVSWERGTLLPMYALPLGFGYCATLGYLEARRLPVLLPPPGDARTRRDGAGPGRPGGPDGPLHPEAELRPVGRARYFLLPPRADGMGGLEIGFDPFLPGTDPIVAGPGPPRGGGTGRGAAPGTGARTGSSAATAPPSRAPGSSTTPGSDPSPSAPPTASN